MEGPGGVDVSSQHIAMLLTMEAWDTGRAVTRPNSVKSAHTLLVIENAASVRTRATGRAGKRTSRTSARTWAGVSGPLRPAGPSPRLQCAGASEAWPG